jgi:hypothetical protein
MDSLFHFVFSIISALAVDLHKKHKMFFVFAAAAFAVAIDFDHFFHIDPFNMKPLHNLLFIIGVPLLLFYFSYRLERNRKPRTTVMRQFWLVVMIMLVGHLITDMFYSPDYRIMLFYPFSYQSYSFADLPLATPFTKYDFITSQGVALLVYFVILMSILFIEDFVKWHEEKHENVKRSINDVVKDFF